MKIKSALLRDSACQVFHWKWDKLIAKHFKYAYFDCLCEVLEALQTALTSHINPKFVASPRPWSGSGVHWKYSQNSEKPLLLMVTVDYKKDDVNIREGRCVLRKVLETPSLGASSCPLPVELCRKHLFFPEMICDNMHRVLPVREILLTRVVQSFS